MDRSQFSGGSLDSIKNEQNRAAKALPTLSSGGGRAEFHKIDEGRNYRRVAPAHKPGEPAYRAKSTVTLECEVPVYDSEGNDTGATEVKRKNIFISTQHSLSLKEDPIVTYIQFVQNKAQEEFPNKNDRSKYLAPITGWRGGDGKWNWGIKPDIGYVCYAWDESGTLGRQELYPQMLDQMKKESIKHNPDESEIIPDIFTDPDEGFPLIIEKVKNDKGKWEYLVSAELPSRKESWPEFFKRTMVTDEQLMELTQKESLTELYSDAYTTRDFDFAIDGLRRFDERYKYGIFQNEDFLNKIAEIHEACPAYSPNKEESQDEQPTKPQAKKVEQHTPKEEVPQATSAAPLTSSKIIPVPTMKRVLKEYISENYGDDYSLPELTKEGLVVWYNLSLQGEELPFDEESSTEEPSPQQEKETPKVIKEDTKPVDDAPNVVTPEPATQTTSAEIDPALAAQIAALRNRRNKNN